MEVIFLSILITDISDFYIIKIKYLWLYLIFDCYYFFHWLCWILYFFTLIMLSISINNKLHKDYEKRLCNQQYISRVILQKINYVRIYHIRWQIKEFMAKSLNKNLYCHCRVNFNLENVTIIYILVFSERSMIQILNR